MLTLQHFKTTRLIVGVLVVSFGLSVVFHALDVHGHGIAIFKNDSYDARVNESTSTTTYSSTCPAGDHSRGYTASTTTYDLYHRTDHYHLNSSLNWVYQYTTGSYVSTETERTSYWETCTYVYSNGNQCGG